MTDFDRTDARLLSALCERPRATGVELAGLIEVSRNTVQSRLERWHRDGTLDGFDRRIPPRHLGLPLLAFVLTTVDQRRLAEVTDRLETIPEVVEVIGLSGPVDLLIRVVAADTDDLYRVAGLLLGIDGVERTNVSLAMQELVPYRIRQLLDHAE
ncbi:Lrp/AsnC family transcriptional regulator [Gordonia sp. DT30]|uniref:Lrp/AsnC family transcriptional regulator n=1 Tax=unclassified Gordonia (in: high G+C Gram-positive bacteria) TaxID=2657482 RepID=UPI003CE90914